MRTESFGVLIAVVSHSEEDVLSRPVDGHKSRSGVALGGEQGNLASMAMDTHDVSKGLSTLSLETLEARVNQGRRAYDKGRRLQPWGRAW